MQFVGGEWRRLGVQARDQESATVSSQETQELELKVQKIFHILKQQQGGLVPRNADFLTVRFLVCMYF